MSAVMTEREAEPDASGCRDKRRQRLDWSITVWHRFRVSRQWASDRTGADDNSQCVTWHSQQCCSADNCSRLLLTTTVKLRCVVNSVLLLSVRSPD